MEESMKKLILTVAFIPTLTFGHGGGLDENGGHIDRSTGEYHCHQADCILPTVATEANIRVASFNIQFLGNFKKRDNAALAALVADQDLVLIQELVAPRRSSPENYPVHLLPRVWARVLSVRVRLGFWLVPTIRRSLSSSATCSH